MFEEMSTAAVESELVTMAGHLAAGTCRSLLLTAEPTRRGGWAGPGLRSCVQWLGRRVGMSARTARDQLRVAHALDGLPAVTAAFAAGRVSYSKVRALTRIATPGTEQSLLNIALRGTTAQLERLVAAARAGVDPRPAITRRGLRTSRAADGSLLVSLRIPADRGEDLTAAVAARLDTLAPAPGGSAQPRGGCAGRGGSAEPREDPADPEEVPARAREHSPGAVVDPVAARRLDALLDLVAGHRAERPVTLVVHLRADHPPPTPAPPTRTPPPRCRRPGVPRRPATRRGSPARHTHRPLSPPTTSPPATRSPAGPLTSGVPRSGPSITIRSGRTRPVSRPSWSCRRRGSRAARRSPRPARTASPAPPPSRPSSSTAAATPSTSAAPTAPPPAASSAPYRSATATATAASTPAAPPPPVSKPTTSSGGAAADPADLDNLALLCWFHHTLTHHHDYHLTPTPDGFTATQPDGTPVPATGPPTHGHPDDLLARHNRHNLTIDDQTITPRWGGERLDHDHALTWLLPRLRPESAVA